MGTGSDRPADLHPVGDLTEALDRAGRLQHRVGDITVQQGGEVIGVAHDLHALDLSPSEIAINAEFMIWRTIATEANVWQVSLDQLDDETWRW